MPRVSASILRVIATVVALGMAWPAIAADRPDKRGLRQHAQEIYDTDRLLPRAGNECAGVPACVVVESPLAVVGADQFQVLAVSCPDSHPFGWHWDTEQHEHIYVKLVGRTRTGFTFSVSNRAGAPGYSRIFIGCSTDAFAATGFQQTQGGVPSRNRTFQGEAAR